MRLQLLYFTICTIIPVLLALKCPAGTRISTRRRRASYCKSCPVGYFMNEDNNQYYTCNACPSGKYNTKSMQTSCSGDICQSGQYGKVGAISSDETICKKCSPGQFQLYSGQEKCNSCLSGKYQPKSGQIFCLGNTTCPVGKFGPENAIVPTIKCTDCYKNTYSNINGSTSCQLCEKNEYQLQSGQSYCLRKGSCSSYKYFNIEKVTCDYVHPYITIEAILCWLAFVITLVACGRSVKSKNGGCSIFICILSVMTSLASYIHISTRKKEISDTTYWVFISLHIVQILSVCIIGSMNEM